VEKAINILVFPSTSYIAIMLLDPAYFKLAWLTSNWPSLLVVLAYKK